MVRKALADLLKKPAGELATEELETLAAEKRKQAENELQKKRGKLQARIERLSSQLEEANKELAALPQPEEPSRRGRRARKPRRRPIRKLTPSKLVDMITLALFEAGKPMTASEAYEKIKAKMKKAGKGGKNPEQAVSSALGTTDRFQRVERGVYELAEEAKQQVAALKGKK